MPWGGGVYTRTNGQFNGAAIWTTDKDNAIKIESVRHDTHDQDIANGVTATLNINGQNSMNVDLNVGSHKVVNLTAGTAAADAVNFTQLQTKADASASVSDQTWDGDELTLVTGAGDIKTPVIEFNVFKSGGPIRHLLDALGNGSTVTVDLDVATRFNVENDGAFTMNFANVPSADDPQLGATYQVEGQVVVWNEGGAGLATVNITGTTRTVGSQDTDSGAVQILTYLIQRRGGSNFNTLVWSTG